MIWKYENAGTDVAKDTHTQRQQTADNGRETKRKKQKIKLKRYRMHGWRWTDGQKDREQDKERERGRRRGTQALQRTVPDNAS